VGRSERENVCERKCVVLCEIQSITHHTYYHAHACALPHTHKHTHTQTHTHMYTHTHTCTPAVLVSMIEGSVNGVVSLA
jgi:hypothetical protein